MELLIRNQWGTGKRLPTLRRRLVRLLDALLAFEGVAPDVEVSLVFCEDDFIHQLNREYRGKDKPTDVLSFPQDLESGMLGDVVISVPYAQRQAKALRQSTAKEVEWLFLHGVLHLLGYNDDTEEELEEMSRRARGVLQSVA
jgi:probable rRNA maturation factor